MNPNSAQLHKNNNIEEYSPDICSIQLNMIGIVSHFWVTFKAGE